MATRSLRGVKRVQGFSFQRSSDGGIPITEFDRAAEEIQRTTSIMNGGLSFGTGESGTIAGNFRAQFVDVVFPAVANTIIAIPHGLGVVPVGVLVAMADRVAVVYHTEFYKGWTPNTIQLYSGTASVKMKLLIFA